MTRTIVLNQGFVLLIDDADFRRVSSMTWTAQTHKRSGKTYVSHTYSDGGKTRSLSLARHLTGAPKDKVVDHINGLTLDNRQANLRICTAAENAKNRRMARTNRAGFKGVCKRWSRWYAYIHVGGRQEHLGSYSTAADAARAYDRRAVEAFGEFAGLNFPSADLIESLKAPAPAEREPVLTPG